MSVSLSLSLHIYTYMHTYTYIIHFPDCVIDYILFGVQQEIKMEPEPYMPYFGAYLCSSSSRWWSRETVAVVTGGNRGIGYALVRRLAELGVTVILAARSREKGEATLASLRAEGLTDVHFLLLDVSDPLSITAFASAFEARFGRTLDILVS